MCGCRVRKADGRRSTPRRWSRSSRGTRWPKPEHLQFFIDPSRCIGCQACVQACTRVRHAQGALDDPPGVRRPRRARRRRCRWSACTAIADLRRGLPGRRHQADRRRRRADRPQAALHRLQQLRAGLPVRRARRSTTIAADDEVRHVLRPHLASARSRCAPRSARARRSSSARARRSSSCGRARRRSNTFQFGQQTITTRVHMMVPRELAMRRAARRRHRGDGRSWRRAAVPCQLKRP